jgi:eukaryotic-like serine/threonine-protein kinase
MRDFFWKVRGWIEKAVEWLREAARKVLPHESDSQEIRNLKLTVFLFVGIISLMILVGLVTFSIAVRGQEETLVPNVQGKELATALIELQGKELYPDIQVQFSTKVEKNLIIDQRPAPGTLVKAGKRIILRVSKGPIIDKVENYVGRSLVDVRAHLQTMFATQAPNLVIREPVIYRVEPGSAPGIILAQNPKPGAQISGLTYLEFVVSRGQGGDFAEVGDYKGMSFQEAVADLMKAGIAFTFTVQKSTKPATAGTVTAQNPDPKEILAYGQSVQLTMSPPPSVGKDNVFGLFQYTLPDYPIAVDIRLEVVSEGGRSTLLAMKHPGGPLAVPYVVPEGSEIILSVLDEVKAEVKASPLNL